MFALALLAVLLLLPTVPALAEQVIDDIGVLAIRMVELYQAKRNAEALPMAQRAVELAEETLGPDHPTVAIYLEFLARVYRALGETALAKDISERAVAIRQNNRSAR